MIEWLLNVWHDLYYKLAPPAGEAWALTCKQAVEQINLGASTTWTGWFRLRLHLSLCRACRHYFQASQILTQAVRQWLEDSSHKDVETINQELIKKYAKPRSPAGN